MISLMEMLPAALAAEGMSPLLGYGMFVVGLLGYFGLDRLLPHAHPQDLMTPAMPRPRNLRRTAILLTLGISLHNFPEGIATYVTASNNLELGMGVALAVALHNIPEGLAVGVAFGALQNGYSPEALMGAVSVAVGIGLQNFPEGAAVSLPLRREGCSRSRSFLVGQASALVEPMAGVLGAWLVTYVQRLLPYALSFAAGAMIYVVVEELIPESQNGEHTNIGTIGVAVGFALMMVLDVALG